MKNWVNAQVRILTSYQVKLSSFIVTHFQLISVVYNRGVYNRFCLNIQSSQCWSHLNQGRNSGYKWDFRDFRTGCGGTQEMDWLGDGNRRQCGWLCERSYAFLMQFNVLLNNAAILTLNSRRREALTFTLTSSMRSSWLSLVCCCSTAFILLPPLPNPQTKIWNFLTRNGKYFGEHEYWILLTLNSCTPMSLHLQENIIYAPYSSFRPSVFYILQIMQVPSLISQWLYAAYQWNGLSLT